MSPLNIFASIFREFKESFIEIKDLFYMLDEQPKFIK